MTETVISEGDAVNRERPPPPRAISRCPLASTVNFDAHDGR